MNEILCDYCFQDDEKIYECEDAEEILKFDDIYFFTPRYLCKDCIKEFDKVVINNDKWSIK